MKKPVVNYKNLRPNNINSPEYRHLLWLLGWIGYFILYLLTENLIPVENCHVIHAPLDDIIPFCEWFIIFYVGWYVLIAASLLYFALYNVENFVNLQKFIIITQVVAMVVYIVYPNCQNLRPAEMPRDNFLTYIINLIYTADTNTGVCPSLHVAYSIGIASTWLKEKSANKLTKTLIVAFCVLVCVSVSFVKQHSVIDIVAAIPLCVFAEWLVFWKNFYAKKLKTKKTVK